MRESKSDLQTSTRPRRDRLLEYMAVILFWTLVTKVSQRLSIFDGDRGSRIPSTLIGPSGLVVGVDGGDGVFDERGMKVDLSQFTEAPAAVSYCLRACSREGQSWGPLPKTYVSSAYARTCMVPMGVGMPCSFSRSKLKRGSRDRLKRMGAKGSPCGTPLATLKLFPRWPFMKSCVYRCAYVVRIVV